MSDKENNWVFLLILPQISRNAKSLITLGKQYVKKSDLEMYTFHGSLVSARDHHFRIN